MKLVIESDGTCVNTKVFINGDLQKGIKEISFNVKTDPNYSIECSFTKITLNSDETIECRVEDIFK